MADVPLTRADPGWAVLRVPPLPLPKWWHGRAAQVRLAMDSLEAARADRCRCELTRVDLFGEPVRCEAPVGLPCRWRGLFLGPQRPTAARGAPTLKSLGLVPASSLSAAVGGPARLRGGIRGATGR